MLQICDRCLNNRCGGEHPVRQDVMCELCGQKKDCLVCEHPIGTMLHPFIPIIVSGMSEGPLRWYCKGHKDPAPPSVREHYIWLWQRHRRLRRDDDVANQVEIEILQEEMDNLWWNMSKPETDAIRTGLWNQKLKEEK